MEKKEYKCTECGTSNFITLLGSKEVVFKTKCSSCATELEMTIDKDEKIHVKPIENNKNEIDKKEIFRIDENEMDIEEEISRIKKKQSPKWGLTILTIFELDFAIPEQKYLIPKDYLQSKL